MYRIRIVFNAPADREHPVYGVAKRTAADVHQELLDLAPVLVYAVSVSVQRTASPGGSKEWQELTASQFAAILATEGEVRHLG